MDVILNKYIHTLKRRTKIGDFGCGEAKIAKTVGSTHDVKSFDLVACDKNLVVECDVAKEGVPLPKDSLDLAVFSLSLMGADVQAYLKEAARVVKPKGSLVVAEVKSRFSEQGESSKEDMLRGLERFYDKLEQLGFKLRDEDVESNKMFVVLRFEKMAKGENAARSAMGKKRKGRKPDGESFKKQKRGDDDENNDGDDNQDDGRIMLKSCTYKRR